MEGKQCDLLKFAFQTTQKILENKRAQFPDLLIVPVLLGDLNAFSFRLSARFCSHKQQNIPSPKMSIKSIKSDNNKGRLLDLFENDLTFPLKNILDTPLMKTVIERGLTHHTNFTKDAVSGKTTNASGIDHIYVGKDSEELVFKFENICSLVSSHNILKLTLKNVFVRPLQKDVPAGRTCLPAWIFLDDFFVKSYSDAITDYCSSLPAPTVENAPSCFAYITGPLLLPLAKKFICAKKIENKVNKVTLKRKLQTLKDKGGFNPESPYHQDVLLIVAQQKKAEENLAFAKLMSITSCADDIINAFSYPEKENVVFEEVSLNSLSAYLRKELKDNHDKIIPALRDFSNNILHTDPYWMTEHVFNYFENLFAPKASAGTEAINHFLKSAQLKYIPNELFEELGENYTGAEYDHIR